MSLFDTEEGFHNIWAELLYPTSWADEREHDQAFHMHALARVRGMIDIIKGGISISSDVLAASKGLLCCWLLLVVCCLLVV